MFLRSNEDVLSFVAYLHLRGEIFLPKLLVLSFVSIKYFFDSFVAHLLEERSSETTKMSSFRCISEAKRYADPHSVSL